MQVKAPEVVFDIVVAAPPCSCSVDVRGGSDGSGLMRSREKKGIGTSLSGLPQNLRQLVTVLSPSEEKFHGLLSSSSSHKLSLYTVETPTSTTHRYTRKSRSL
jgi:hypothetical protein